MPPKGSGKSATAHAFSIGDICLGRIKGYPPWPARIVDPETEYLSKAVQKQKPKGAAFLVRYYDDANYSWSPAKELKPLSEREIEDYVTNDKKKKGALYTAYKTAQNPTAWELKHEESMEEARKYEAERAANADELESETEAPEQGSKKRKRKEGGGKKKGRADQSEDELADKPTKKPKAAPTGQEAEPGFKQCKEWRRELQKGFLSKTMPKPEEMPNFDKIFKDIEAYSDKSEYLEAHKLPKVIKRIASLPENTIPRDEEFNVRKRCGEIVSKWQKLFHTDAAPATNGDLKTDEVKAADSSAAPAIDGMDVDEPAKSEPVAPAVEEKKEEPASSAPAVVEPPKEPTPAPKEPTPAPKEPSPLPPAPKEPSPLPTPSAPVVEAPSSLNDLAAPPIEKPKQPSPVPPIAGQEPPKSSESMALNGSGEPVGSSGDAPPAQSTA